MNNRKIIQIIPIHTGDGYFTWMGALCDDGSIWKIDLSEYSSGWEKLPSIPDKG